MKDSRTSIRCRGSENGLHRTPEATNHIETTPKANQVRSDAAASGKVTHVLAHLLGQVILVAVEVALADRYAVLVQRPLELVAGVCVLPLRA